MENNFFVINKQAFKENDDFKHKNLTKKQYDEAEEVKYIVKDGLILIDADSKESTEVIKNLNKNLCIEPYHYESSPNHTHFWYRVNKEQQEIINSNKFNSTSKMLAINQEIDTRSFNTNTKTTGAVYLKQNGKHKGNRPTPEKLIEELNKELPEVPYLLLLHKKYGMIPRKGISEWDKYSYKTVGMLRADNWTKEMVIKLFDEASLFYLEEKRGDEIIHKWEISKPLKTNESGFKDWTSGFEWRKVSGKDEEIKEYLASDIKNYKIIAEHMVKELKLCRSDDDYQIWGIEQGQMRNIRNFGLYVAIYIINKIGNIKPTLPSQIKSYLEGFIPIKKLSKDEFAITFGNNKTYNVMLDKELSLSDDVMNTNIIPYNISFPLSENGYEKESKILNKAIKNWTNNDEEIEQEIYELIGTCLSKYMGREKAFFLVGNGSNGKSLFIKFLNNVIGLRNVSNEDLRDLSTNAFSGALVYGNLLNSNGDMSSNSISDSSKFKKWVTGDRQSVSFKGKDAFPTESYATLVYGTNDVPYIHDNGDSDGANRRIKLILFNKTFRKTQNHRDAYEFISSLFSERVYELIIIRSLKAMNKALNGGGFMESKVAKKALEDHLKESNHMFDYVEERKFEDGETLNGVYADYMIWCKDNNHKDMLAKNHFWKKYQNAVRNTYTFTTYKDKVSQGEDRYRVYYDKEED